MIKRLDRSERLSKFIDSLSNRVARQRGLPLLVGIGLVIVAFIVQAVNVFADSNLLELLGVVLQNGGILTALIGIAMITPLGK